MHNNSSFLPGNKSGLYLFHAQVKTSLTRICQISLFFSLTVSEHKIFRSLNSRLEKNIGFQTSVPCKLFPCLHIHTAITKTGESDFPHLGLLLWGFSMFPRSARHLYI